MNSIGVGMFIAGKKATSAAMKLVVGMKLVSEW